MSEINSKTISNTIGRNYDNYREKINLKYIRANTYDKYKNTNSWDFTPFPKFLFPDEKKHFLKDVNKLDFPGVSDNWLSNKNDREQKNKIFIEEVKGDITKHRAPAYTFGSPRNEVKIPFYDFHELISPSPGSYNLRPLEGMKSSSPKFSFPKKITNKYKYIFTDVSPGPGHYQISKCDLSNQGNYQLSTFINTPSSNFGSYKEQRDKDIAFRNRNNINVGPGSYETDKSLTMFSGNGKFAISTFKSNNGKTIPNKKSFHRYLRGGMYPGPGTYNHHSIFIGGRYSK